MKIRCGSHQQNRSIVRPGLSLMAAKVALTAEEFRENSQRSIDLFNTEKLSTNSTRVLKSVYCNSVHFCRCNLHGACGGKEQAGGLALAVAGLQSARGVWRQRTIRLTRWRWWTVAICAGRVEAKVVNGIIPIIWKSLQSARGVWRQRSNHWIEGQAYWLQSARGVWRQSLSSGDHVRQPCVAICTGRVEAKTMP